MTTTWHLRGYDRQTCCLATDFHIEPAVLPVVRDILPVTYHDPALIDPRELERYETALLAEAIGLSIDPDGFDYFVEAEEDWRVVASMRESRA